MEEKITTINVTEVIAPIISSRDVIKNFEKIIIKVLTKNVYLDFNGVKFISRSAADELLKLKEKLCLKKEIKFININEDITKILDVVKSTQSISNKKNFKIKIKAKDITLLIT